MKVTKVLELKTAKDVEAFCLSLQKLKDEAPKSLSFVVAVTAIQDTHTIMPHGRRYINSHIESELSKLDGTIAVTVDQVPPIVKRQRPNKYKRRAMPSMNVIYSTEE